MNLRKSKRVYFLVGLFSVSLGCRSASSVRAPTLPPVETAESLRLRGNMLSERGQLEEAFVLYIRSCARGDAKGCFNMALAEIRGEGTTPSCTIGYSHLSKSCELGFSKACEVRELLPSECRTHVVRNTEDLLTLCRLSESPDCEEFESIVAEEEEQPN